MQSPIRIDEGHDTVALQNTYDSDGIIQISSFLDPGSAKLVEGLLLGHSQWSLSSVDEDRNPFSVDYESVLENGIAHEEFVRKAYRAAGSRFCYMFASFPIMDRFWAASCPERLTDLAEFLAGDEFLAFVGGVTNVHGRQTDGHMARYGRGHFLSLHTDATAPRDGRVRAVAFVLNLSREWRSDWGGLTTFWKRGSKVGQTFVPEYNSLLVFKVPIDHSVSAVAPFAPHDRLSVAGWIHNEVSEQPEV